MAKIQLANNKGFVFVDDVDFCKLSSASWYLTRSGYAASYTYNPGEHVYMHRVICPDGEYADHIDGNRLNNQRNNLRPCSMSQNLQNQKLRKDSSSGYKGVSWKKDKKKYKAYINFEGKQLHLGYFSDPIEASRVYDEYAIKLFKEFARCNGV